MQSGMALVVTQAVPRTSAFTSGRAVRPFRRPPPPPLVAGACSLRAVQRSPLRPCGLAARQGFPCRRPITASSAAAAAAPPGNNASGVSQPAPPLYRDTDRVLAIDPSYRDPALLPPPPDSASAGQVMLYLLRISFGEAQLTWRLVVALALLATSKAAGLASPFYFKRAVDALSSGGGTATVASAAAAALVLTGLCRAVSGIAKEMQGPVFAPVAQDAGRRVSFYTFAHVLGLDLAFHLNRKTGSLSRMLERGARSVSMIFRAIVFTFLPTAVELTAVCVILARSFHPRVSLLVVATFAAYAAWTVVLTRVAAAIRRQVKNLDNEITGKAVDALLNFETVKLFGNDLLEVRQYDTSLTAYQRSVVRLDIAAAALNAGQALILAGGMTGAMLAAALGTATPSAAAVAAAVTAGGSKVAATTAAGITAGDLVMIQGLLLHLWAPLQFLGWFYRELRQSLVDMEDLLTLLRTPPTLTDGTRLLPAEAPLPALAALAGTTSATAAAAAGAGSDSVHASSSSHSSSSNSGTLQQQQQQEAESNAERRASNGAASTSSTAADAIGSSSSSRQGLRLELRDVSFGYAEGGMASGGGRQVLKGVSLSAEPGESIAIVGPSGGGKSTLLRLLVRLYDADGGQVLLNGVDVRELQQDSLRAAVAVVPQDTVLFNDTIVHNVAYGRPGATWGEVQAAAAAAQLDAAVGRMPLGWQTVVGERGLKLSGGEKQRVAIARAFLRRPRLLICDEATSALDTATERGIQASLRALAAGRTAVFVAHRLSTVQGCDRIYVLADGRVAEQGTHAQLMAARGIYFEMWQMQRAQQALEDHLQQEGGSDGGSAGSGGTSDAPGPSSPQLGERQVPVSSLPGTGSPPAGVETSSDEEGDELARLAELSAAEAPNRHGRHRT